MSVGRAYSTLSDPRDIKALKSVLNYSLLGLLLCCLARPGGAATHSAKFQAMRALLAGIGTTPCVTIPDFYIPSAYDYSILSLYGVGCVRFDLGAANVQQVAASQAEVRAVVAHGLKILLVSPYVPLGAAPSGTLFTTAAAITAQTVALSPQSFLYVELMNEANDVSRFFETQFTPAQYVLYANTISAALLPYQTNTSTSGVTFNNPNYLSWLDATVPNINAPCVGAHFYSVSPNFFGSAISRSDCVIENKCV
jgi:hypothetical protein